MVIFLLLPDRWIAGGMPLQKTKVYFSFKDGRGDRILTVCQRLTVCTELVKKRLSMSNISLQVLVDSTFMSRYDLCLQISDTIEGRILQVQKRKTAIVKEAFRGKGVSGADSESMENLKIMFGEN